MDGDGSVRERTATGPIMFAVESSIFSNEVFPVCTNTSWRSSAYLKQYREVWVFGISFCA